MTSQMAAGLCVAGAVLVGTALLGDVVSLRDATPQRVTVVYWEKWTGSEATEMRKVVAAFNRSQDKIEVRYLTISGVDTKTMLATAGGDPPDVAGIWQDDICQFSDANALTDLTAMANAVGLNQSYYIPGYWDGLTFRGRLWALPSTPASIALHVRTDLVPKDVATPETFPKTLEGFDRFVDRVSKKRADGSLQLAGFLPSDPGWWNWAWPGLFGGKLMNGDKVTMNSPEALRAFNWIATYGKRFGSKEVQSFQSGFGNFESPQDPFMDGKVATELNGVWKGKYIKVLKPDTPWFAVPFPYPENRPDLANHTILSQDVLVIPRGSKHVKEAFEFLKYVQRQDVMEGLCIGHGKNSPLQKVSEHFFAVHPNRYIRLFDSLARSPGAVVEPKVGIYTQISNEMTVAFQKVTTDQASPEQALNDAQARVQKIWDVYRQQVAGDAK